MYKLLYKKPNVVSEVNPVEKEIQQEEYVIKFSIYSKTRDTDIFNKPLQQVLRDYSNLVAYEDSVKKQLYDSRTGLPRFVTLMDYQSFIHKLEKTFYISPMEGEKIIQDALALYSKNGSAFVDRLIVNYDWLLKYHLNPKNYKLTLYLYSLLPKHLKDKKLSEMISLNPTYYPLYVLRSFKSELSKFNDQSDISPLLKVYLAGHYDKYSFYKALGYSENITYTNTFKFGKHATDGLYSIISSNKTSFHSAYEGKTLKEVVDLFNPEIRSIYYSD